jgi:Rrf2 family protein
MRAWLALRGRRRRRAEFLDAWRGHRNVVGRRDRVGPVRISERVDNAVRAMAELAATEGSMAKAETIATSQDISLKFLLDIFRDLKRGELVRSKRGPDGGFMLSRPPDEISLADIFRAVDGPLADVHDESLRDLQYKGPAVALPEVWMAIRGSLRRVLETVTLADLVAGELPPEVADLAAEYRRSTEERHGTRR